MTPEQIKERCVQFLESLRIDPSNLLSDNMAATESLYREAMAEGIQVASIALSAEVALLVAELNDEAEVLKGGALLRAVPRCRQE